MKFSFSVPLLYHFFLPKTGGGVILNEPSCSLQQPGMGQAEPVNLERHPSMWAAGPNLLSQHPLLPWLLWQEAGLEDRAACSLI